MATAALGGHPHPNGPCVGLVPFMDGQAARFRADSKVPSWALREDYKATTRNCFPAGRYCSASVTRPDHLADWDHSRLTEGWSSVFADKRLLYLKPSGSVPNQSIDVVFAKARSVITPNWITT